MEPAPAATDGLPEREHSEQETDLDYYGSHGFFRCLKVWEFILFGYIDICGEQQTFGFYWNLEIMLEEDHWILKFW